ncbi:Protein of unknown function [Gryllus bimaculatus]|nr:Protein of unknown function [Gryllus bimaculatus]
MSTRLANGPVDTAPLAPTASIKHTTAAKELHPENARPMINNPCTIIYMDVSLEYHKPKTTNTKTRLFQLLQWHKILRASQTTLLGSHTLGNFYIIKTNVKCVGPCEGLALSALRTRLHRLAFAVGVDGCPPPRALCPLARAAHCPRLRANAFCLRLSEPRVTRVVPIFSAVRRLWHHWKHNCRYLRMLPGSDHPHTLRNVVTQEN